MIDPERLLETDLQDATSLRERELLASLKPSTGTQGAVWRRIVGQGVLVAGATAATAAATTTAASAAASGVEAATASAATGAASITTTTGVMSSLAAKAGVALIVAAPILGGTAYLTQSAPEREEPAAATASIPAPVKARPAQNATAELAKAAEPTVVPVPEPTKLEVNSAASQSNADALREENRLLREARSFERAGNPGQAMRTLNELDRSFAHGALLQEREILRIQSLSATGATSAAKTRAEQFLKRYPASPYAAHVRSILDGSPPQ
jgi:hypothetical protein